MERRRLTLSCNEYDRTRFLVDGRVQAEGIDLSIVSLTSEERHRRFSRDLECDVCELQMGVFLGWMGRGAPFTAIPVFPHRKFCHGNVILNAGSRIQKPEDLAGKIIGMRAHFNPVERLCKRGFLVATNRGPRCCRMTLKGWIAIFLRYTCARRTDTEGLEA